MRPLQTTRRSQLFPQFQAAEWVTDASVHATAPRSAVLTVHHPQEACASEAKSQVPGAPVELGTKARGS